MKRLFYTFMMAVVAMSVNAQYQIGNSDFEQWESVTYNSKTGEEPLQWSSFLDGTGSLKGTAGAIQLWKSTETRPGTTGSYSAEIKARKVLFVIAQGNLTTGCVNMGSMTASDASGNYNYINENRTDQSMRFTGHPDAARYWVKFNGKNNGKVSIVLTTKGYYQDPEANDITATVVASSINSTLPSNSTWTEYVVPFDVNDATKDPYYALVNVSTSSVPGNGSADDHLYVDDMEMLYYSEAKSIMYDGQDILGKSKMDCQFDPTKLTDVQMTGRAATWSYSFDEEAYALTVTVKGENFSEDATNFHSYTIPFTKSEGGETTSVTKTYKEDLYVGVDGEMFGPMDSEVQITFNDDNTIDMGLYDFVINMDGSSMPVGNIVIKNISLTDTGNNYSTFEYNGDLEIAPGTDPSVPADEWIGPMLGTMSLPTNGKINEEKLFVTITLSVLGQNIEVQLGDKEYFDNLDGGASVTKTYKEDLYVGVDGEMFGPMDSEVQITFNDDNTIDMGLYDFVINMDGSSMPVGNIVIKNISLTDTGNNYSTFEYNGDLEIAPGTDPSVPADEWIGPMLGTMSLPTNGKINDEKLFVTITLSVLGQNIEVQLGDKEYFDNLDGGTTGIADFVTEKSSAGSCYNLQGQRVNPSAKGIRIVNGRLVLNR
jgi:hypothetical protein